MILKLCFGLCSLFCCSNSVYAQDVYQDRYLIQIPDSWKKKPKFLIKLADVLTANIPVLKDKQETLTGKAKYRATIFLTNPIIDYVTAVPNSRDVSVKFRFCAYFNVYNEEDQLLHRLIIIDSLETQTATVNVPVRDPKSGHRNYDTRPHYAEVVTARDANILRSIPTVRERSSSHSSSSPSVNVTREQLWHIVKRRISKTKLDDIGEEE